MINLSFTDLTGKQAQALLSAFMQCDGTMQNIQMLVEADAMFPHAGVQPTPASAVPVVPAPVSVQTPTPVQTPPVPASAVSAPVTVPLAAAPSYTLDQLSVAATPLLDAGKLQELQQLLRTFSVESLTALPPEQYGAFATALRGMGAKI